MMMNAILQISHYEQLVDDTLKYIKDDFNDSSS